MIEDFLLSSTVTFTFIAIVVILIQSVYLALKLFDANKATGHFTWKRVRRAFKPTGWGQWIFDLFVLLVVVRDILHFFFARNGLPLSSFLFVTMLVLFVITAAMDRLQNFGRRATDVKPVAN